MKNIFKLAVVFSLAGTLALSSCIKETFPQGGSATSDQITSNAKAFESQLRGIAGYMLQPATLASKHYELGYPGMVTIREVWGNDVVVENTGYEWFGNWHENNYQGENYMITQYVWNYYTELVSSANFIIEYDEGEATAENLKAGIGAAYAFRALFFLDMGQMYEFKPNNYTSKPEVEGLTIPHLREGITEEEARFNPRLPKAELVELIRADLNKAIEYTHGRSRIGIEFPGEAVAYGLLARLEMWNEDYDAAKAAAQKAIELSGCTPLTEAQWTDTATGFNDATSQNSWMWGLTLTKESPAVKSGLLNSASWFASETYFGYCGAGAFRSADAQFYSQISNTDFRKKSWKPLEGSKLDVPMIGATSSYDPAVVPPLAGVKFRPASGNPDDYLIGAIADFPLMRVEEMHFIIAECDARNGDGTYFANFMKTYRDPNYFTVQSGDELVREVLFQKRVEFWMEGVVFFDYKRCPDLLEINRGYKGTNHYDLTRFNCEGLAPWMNVVIVVTEINQNPAIVNNPDPSGTVKPWAEE